MTGLASELDQKLAQLSPAKALALERLVRNAMALAESGEDTTSEGTKGPGAGDPLNLRVHHLPLAGPISSA